MRCFILEDQAPARRILQNYITRLSGFEITGSAAMPSAASEMLENETIDILFLDLGLPQIDGFAFLERLEAPPVVIVTTAFADRAVDGFAHGVADYLVKPFAFDRFKQATDRALLAMRARQDDTIIAIPVDRGVREFISTKNIASLSADGDYVRITTTNNQLHTLGPLGKWETKLPSPPFVRTHRSHLVNIDFVESIGGGSVTTLGETLSIGSTYKSNLMRMLKIKTGPT